MGESVKIIKISRKKGNRNISQKEEGRCAKFTEKLRMIISN